MVQEAREQKAGTLILNDFSPGIIQRTGVQTATTSPASMGAAQVTNTYRCIALPGGGLGPLPRRVTDRFVNDLGAANPPAVAIVQAMRIMGPMVATGGTSPAFPPLSASPYELHIMFEYVSGGTQTHKWVRYPYFSGATPTVIATASQPETDRYGVGWLNIMRMFHPAPATTVGYPVVVGTWQSPNDPQVANTDYAMVFPDPTSAVTVATLTPFDLSSGSNVMRGMNTTHQNRLIVLQRAVDVHGSANDAMSTNERFRFTLPNDYTQDTPSSTTVFGQEVPVGFGLVASITASDLLLIKHEFGAFLVQGDLINPIIRRLPGVVGTGGLEMVGASTPAGFVYGSRGDGVFLWNGGDTSEEISLHMEDGFWQITDTVPYNFGGVFMAWGGLILTPNNFVYDPYGKSWWRLEDYAIGKYAFYDREPVSNQLVATPAQTGPSQKIASLYSQQLAATNFSWNSQPFRLSNRRTVQLRELYVEAQGSGTVTVTVGSDGSIVSQPSAVTISSSTPRFSRGNMNVQGSEFTIRIVSDGGSNEAPIVYSLEFVFDEISNVLSD